MLSCLGSRPICLLLYDVYFLINVTKFGIVLSRFSIHFVFLMYIYVLFRTLHAVKRVFGRLSFSMRLLCSCLFCFLCVSTCHFHGFLLGSLLSPYVTINALFIYYFFDYISNHFQTLSVSNLLLFYWFICTCFFLMKPSYFYGVASTDSLSAMNTASSV